MARGSMLASLGPVWKNLGFAQGVSVGIWVDNIFAISYSTSGVAKILDEAEGYLLREFFPAKHQNLRNDWKKVLTLAPGALPLSLPCLLVFYPCVGGGDF